jgi:hypothetical protein
MSTGACPLLSPLALFLFDLCAFTAVVSLPLIVPYLRSIEEKGQRRTNFR